MGMFLLPLLLVPAAVGLWGVIASIAKLSVIESKKEFLKSFFKTLLFYFAGMWLFTIAVGVPLSWMPSPSLGFLFFAFMALVPPIALLIRAYARSAPAEGTSVSAHAGRSMGILVSGCTPIFGLFSIGDVSAFLANFF
jgi:hypothetical protein